MACWRLIGYFREPEYVWKADKAFLLTFAGAVLMLLGFGLVFAKYGTFDLVGPGSLAGKPIGAMALILIMAGIFSKSATVPLHTWLPDAGVAPSTITSLLHAAILVKIGLYGFARMFLNGMVIPQRYWVWILGFAMASAFISACAAYMETNIKRLLAYSTVSQIGYTFLGFAAVASWGYIGAILYIMAPRPGQGRPLPVRRHRGARDPHQGHDEDGRPHPEDAHHGHRLRDLRPEHRGHPAAGRVLRQGLRDHRPLRRRPPPSSPRWRS